MLQFIHFMDSVLDKRRTVVIGGKLVVVNYCAREDQEGRDLIQIEIATELYNQISELIAPMHLSHEELVAAFLRWCANPVTQEDATAWLRKAMQ